MGNNSPTFFSDSTAEPVSTESEIVRVFSNSTMEISEITPLKSDLQGPKTISCLTVYSLDTYFDALTRDSF